MRISLLIKTKGPSSFGDIRMEYGADLMTVRSRIPSLGLDVPIIPGTQIKGCLRTVATSIHNVLAEKKIISWNINEFKKCLGSLKNPCRKCLICITFGYSGIAQAPLYVTNFYPTKKDKVKEIAEQGLIKALQNHNYWLTPETLFITRTRIDDSKGTVFPGALYTYEHIYPGTIFYGEIYLFKNILKHVLKTSSEDIIKRFYLDAATLIIASIAQLNYITIGRNSICTFKILKLEPKELALEHYIKTILYEFNKHEGD